MSDGTSNSGWNDIFNSSLEVIKNKANLRNDITTLSGYREFMQIREDAIADIITSAMSEMEMEINIYIPNSKDNFQQSTSRGCLKRSLDISKKRYLSNLKGEKLEESLERSIVASFDDLLYNQFNLLSGINNMNRQGKRSSVDFVDLRKPNCFRIVELKQWDNERDCPISAMLEVLSYYFAFRKLKSIDADFYSQSVSEYKLHVLAPLEYYEYWSVGSKTLVHIANTMNMAMRSNSETNVMLSLNVLPLSKEAFLDAIRGVTDSYECMLEANKNAIRIAYLKSLEEA